jgi:hypothetical protein
MFDPQMIVNDVDVAGTLRRPTEHHAPLLVDSNTVETTPAATQSFQPVAWRRSQVAQPFGVIDHVEFRLAIAALDRQPTFLSTSPDTKNAQTDSSLKLRIGTGVLRPPSGMRGQRARLTR